MIAISSYMAGKSQPVVAARARSRPADTNLELTCSSSTVGHPDLTPVNSSGVVFSDSREPAVSSGREEEAVVIPVVHNVVTAATMLNRLPSQDGSSISAEGKTVDLPLLWPSARSRRSPVPLGRLYTPRKAARSSSIMCPPIPEDSVLNVDLKVYEAKHL
jgi:hypothetical protein